MVLRVGTIASLGSLMIFEGAAGEFKGALGSWQPLIPSPVQGGRDLFFTPLSTALDILQPDRDPEP